jgi:restriction endonuclease Mrr
VLILFNVSACRIPHCTICIHRFSFGEGIITTGRFTRDAVAEATREGAPPIDLIDGDRLAEMLKALKLGVRTELVEKVIVDETWLGSL